MGGSRVTVSPAADAGLTCKCMHHEKKKKKKPLINTDAFIIPCLTPVRLAQRPRLKKGGNGAGDYGQEANFKVKTDSERSQCALSVRSSVFKVKAASITLVSSEGKCEKSSISFPLIICVHPITISKENSPLSNDYCAERAKLYHVFAGILMCYVWFSAVVEVLLPFVRSVMQIRHSSLSVCVQEQVNNRQVVVVFPLENV